MGLFALSLAQGQAILGAPSLPVLFQVLTSWILWRSLRSGLKIWLNLVGWWKSDRLEPVGHLPHVLFMVCFRPQLWVSNWTHSGSLNMWPLENPRSMTYLCLTVTFSDTPLCLAIGTDKNDSLKKVTCLDELTEFFSLGYNYTLNKIQTHKVSFLGAKESTDSQQYPLCSGSWVSGTHRPRGPVCLRTRQPSIRQPRGEGGTASLTIYISEGGEVGEGREGMEIWHITACSLTPHSWASFSNCSLGTICKEPPGECVKDVRSWTFNPDLVWSLHWWNFQVILSHVQVENHCLGCGLPFPCSISSVGLSQLWAVDELQGMAPEPVLGSSVYPQVYILTAHLAGPKPTKIRASEIKFLIYFSKPSFPLWHTHFFSSTSRLTNFEIFLNLSCLLPLFHLTSSHMGYMIPSLFLLLVLMESLPLHFLQSSLGHPLMLIGWPTILACLGLKDAGLSILKLGRFQESWDELVILHLDHCSREEVNLLLGLGAHNPSSLYITATPTPSLIEFAHA